MGLGMAIILALSHAGPPRHIHIPARCHEAPLVKGCYEL